MLAFVKCRRLRVKNKRKYQKSVPQGIVCSSDEESLNDVQNEYSYAIKFEDSQNCNDIALSHRRENSRGFGSSDTSESDDYISLSMCSSFSSDIIIEKNEELSLDIGRFPRNMDVVERIRVKFLDSIDEVNQYSELDIDEFRNPITANNVDSSLGYRFIARFLVDSSEQKKDLSISKKEENLKPQDEESKVINRLSEFLKFRERYKLADCRSDQFMKEFYLLNEVFTFGLDKKGLPVLYLASQAHRRWSKKLDQSIKRFVAWHLDSVTNSNSSKDLVQGDSTSRSSIGWFVLCYDCTGITLANVDMDLLKFLVDLMLNYYPKYCRYCLLHNLPWLFRSIWALVRSWLPQDARESVHLTDKKQLTNFIDVNQLPKTLRSSDEVNENSSEGTFKLPENWSEMKNIDDYANLLELNSEEINAFKSHVSNTVHRYKELGALELELELELD